MEHKMQRLKPIANDKLSSAVSHFRLPPRSRREPRSSGLLRGE